MYKDDRPPLLLDKRILLGGGAILLTIAIIAFGLSGVFSVESLLGGQASGGNDELEMADMRYETHYADIELVVSGLSKGQRRNLVSDQSTFTQFVAKEIERRAMIAAAREAGLDKNAKVAFLMQRGSDDVLAQNFLIQYAKDHIPSGFPSDQMIRDFYSRNQADFAIEARVHVYQIYFRPGADTGEKAMAKLKSKAAGIAKSINRGKLDFATAAAEHSAHSASAINGGYVGLLKESQLRPEVGGAVLALAEGKVSKPYVFDDGVHLFMRGEKVARQPVSLQQAAVEIKKLLIKQLQHQQRNGLVTEIGQEHPVAISDATVEQWRMKLQSASGWSSIDRK